MADDRDLPDRDDHRDAARQERPEEPRSAEEVARAADRAEHVESHHRPAADPAGIAAERDDAGRSTSTTR
jgi:hypothetical protein